jgi:hypothetical protein
MRKDALPSVLGLGVDLAESGSRERGIFDRLMFKMHYSKLLVKTRPSCFLTSWMQCLNIIFSSKAANAAAGWPSGGRNEYFCRPHHHKEAKITIRDKSTAGKDKISADDGRIKCMAQNEIEILMSTTDYSTFPVNVGYSNVYWLKLRSCLFLFRKFAAIGRDFRGCAQRMNVCRGQAVSQLCCELLPRFFCRLGQKVLPMPKKFCRPWTLLKKNICQI